MKEYQATSDFTIKLDTWGVRIEYDEYPEIDNGSQIAYAAVTGPTGEAFVYEFHFTKHLMRNHKYLLTHINDRVNHAIMKTKTLIKRGNFQNLVITISPKGTDVQTVE